MTRSTAISVSAIPVLFCYAVLGAGPESLARFGEPTHVEPAAEKPILTGAVGSQETLPLPRELSPKQVLGPVQEKQVSSGDAALPELWNAAPITFISSLKLAQTNNLDIAQATQVVNQARALLLRANSAFLPNLNLGSNYTHHEGNIQKTEGNIIKANKDALFVGGGPSMSFAMADVIYTRLIAQQVRNASKAGFRRVANDTFLSVANAYLNVMRARRKLARVDETLEFLLSDRPAAARAESKGLLPVVRNFVEAGGLEALKSELNRVEVEVYRRQEERRGAMQELRVAAAELARLIRLDPEIALWPVEDFRYPMPLPGDKYSELSLKELMPVAIANRPELAENRALVEAAFRRIQAARSRPFLPNVVMNYAWGDFGGSPNLVPAAAGVPQHFGASGSIHHFNTRSDFDLAVYWKLQGMGLGDYANIREQQALHRQAQFRQVQMFDRVIAEIVQAFETVQGWRQRVQITASSLFDDQGLPRGPVFSSLRWNFERIRNVPGTRPLEVLDSIRGLNDLLDSYGQAVTEYERARFRLLIALGLPPEKLIETQLAPAPAPAEG